MQLIYAQTFHALHLGIPHKSYDIMLTKFLAHVQLGHFLSCFATFFSGILIAVICCWEAALLTLLVVPLILGIGATYIKKLNTITAAKMIYQSEATSMVEQVRVSKAQLIAN